MYGSHFSPRWCKPSYAEEVVEFQRVELTLKIPLDKLRARFVAGELVYMPKWMWCSMDNTDSNDVFSLAEAEGRAKLYDRNLSRIVQGMSSRSNIPAPIVLQQGDARPHLVAGNMRLTACRVLNVRPKVWLMSMEAT